MGFAATRTVRIKFMWFINQSMVFCYCSLNTLRQCKNLLISFFFPFPSPEVITAHIFNILNFFIWFHMYICITCLDSGTSKQWYFQAKEGCSKVLPILLIFPSLHSKEIRLSSQSILKFIADLHLTCYVIFSIFLQFSNLIVYSLLESKWEHCAKFCKE